MKKVFVALMTSLVFATAHAVLITDNFDRANTAFVTNNAGIASTIGANWTSAAPATNTTYRIFNNTVDIGSTSAATWQKAMLINTAAGTTNSGVGSFTLSAQLQQNTTAGTAFIGLVFNYQDADNFYVFRLSGTGSAQMLAYSNGVLATVFSKTGAFTPIQDRPYTFTVSSADPYIFDVSIFDTVASSTVYSTNVTLGATIVKHQDGLGGMFGSSSFVTMDNFSLDAVPEPATIGMLGLGALAMVMIRRLRKH